jgi:hypothetical protein
MFNAIVRGYQGMGMGSGFGAVVVEVTAEAEIPRASCFREIGAIKRSDGLTISRAVKVIGDWRPCRDIAEALKDQPVRVGLDDMGLMPVFELAE